VDVVAPTVTDHILDPACGTGGFLVSAYKHILARHTAGFDDYRPTLNNRTDEQLAGVRWGDLLTAPQKAKLGKNIEGYDITPLMTRLARVNLYLHHFPSPNIQDYDTIGMNTRWGDKFDVILANPPFMTPKGGVEAHDRFRLKSSKKAEVLFSDYILEHLNPDGRAGFIVPEGIVFTNSGDYVTLRKWAINEGGLWAVVSLPAGVFQPYSGVKTTILFIDRGFRRQHDNILLLKVENDGYSLNANRNPITKNDLPLAWEMLTVFRDQPEEFTALYGDADTAPTADVLKFRVVPRADFGRLDAYKATATAKDYLKKAYAALPPLPDLSVRPTNGLADKLDNFRRLTGWPVTLLPTDENELMEWFNREVKEAAIAYGARLQEEMILGVGVKEELEKKREYSLSLDHQTRNDFQKQSAFEVVTVRDLCLSIVSGGTPSTESPDFWNGHIPWITSADIQDIRTITPRKFITEKGLKNSATSLIPAHNIIVVTRVSLGKMAINKFDICTSQDSMGLIVDKSKILVDYLAYILLEEVQKFKEIGKGVTIRGVSKNDLEEIQIPRPPLSIQQQIVDEISGYQKVIDGCRLL
ncbi:MAG: N-6 DNA methylase, partial [Saprospiraceae bacterium]